MPKATTHAGSTVRGPNLLRIFPEKGEHAHATMGMMTVKMVASKRDHPVSCITGS